MFELVVGFIVAAILFIAEYLLCTKFKSPSLGRNYSRFDSRRNDLVLFASGRIPSETKYLFPFVISKHPVFWRLGDRPRQIQEN